MNSENIVTISLPNFLTIGGMSALFIVGFGFVIMAINRALNNGG